MIQELQVKGYLESRNLLLGKKIDSLNSYITTQKDLLLSQGKQITNWQSIQRKHSLALDLAKNEMLHLKQQNQKLRKQKRTWQQFTIVLVPVSIILTSLVK